MSSLTEKQRAISSEGEFSDVTRSYVGALRLATKDSGSKSQSFAPVKGGSVILPAADFGF
jgi:hypothetical protein